MPSPPPPTTLSAAAAAATTSSSQRGIRTITISAPGVLLEETNPKSFSEGATVLPSSSAALLAALLEGGGLGSIGSSNNNKSFLNFRSLLANANVYILCQVSDDIGEAAVRAALEFSGLMGPNPGQIPSQRFLFCETEVGKMSLVRQIEPEVHIDGECSTVEQLKRFIPRLIEVRNKNNSVQGEKTSSAIVVENFEEAMKLLSS
jgi:hypothetical protein